MIVSGVASAALLAVSEEAIERTIEWTEDD